MPQVPDVPLGGLYGDVILDHYRNPRNRQPVADADVEAQEFNPFCGDRAELRLKLGPDGQVAQVSVLSEGCSIIQASASLMSEALLGKTTAEAQAMAVELRRMLRDDAGGASQGGDGLGDLQALNVVRQFPVRIKCALLPWTALEIGIESYRSKTG